MQIGPTNINHHAHSYAPQSPHICLGFTKGTIFKKTTTNRHSESSHLLFCLLWRQTVWFVLGWFFSACLLDSHWCLLSRMWCLHVFEDSFFQMITLASSFSSCCSFVFEVFSLIAVLSSRCRVNVLDLGGFMCFVSSGSFVLCCFPFLFRCDYASL